MWRSIVLGLAVLAAAAGLFVLGRATTGHPPSRYQSGYLAGVQAGRAEGDREGRALQEGAQLPSSAQQQARAEFQAGYAAGANDAFGAYDGGWSFAVPYVITLGSGTDGITYRIADRVELSPHVAYFLCPDGRSLCTSHR